MLLFEAGSCLMKQARKLRTRSVCSSCRLDHWLLFKHVISVPSLCFQHTDTQHHIKHLKYKPCQKERKHTFHACAVGILTNPTVCLASSPNFMGLVRHPKECHNWPWQPLQAVHPDGSWSSHVVGGWHWFHIPILRIEQARSTRCASVMNCKKKHKIKSACSQDVKPLPNQSINWCPPVIQPCRFPIIHHWW